MPGDEPGRDPLDFPPEPTNQRGVLLGVCVMGAGLAICGIGLIINTFVGRPQPASPQPRPSPVVAAVAEQAAVVREALNTARQARDLQRERVEALQREMELGEQSSAGVLPVGLGK